MKIVQRPPLQKYVEEKVRLGWSPELIAGRIKEVDMHIPYASHRGIYKFIYSVYGRQIESFLVRKGKHPKQKYLRSEKIADRVFIEERPEIIENQGRFGDWEGDLIVSGKYGKGVLLVLYERNSCYVLIKRLMTTSPDAVNEAFRRLTGGILCMNSMTLDNDLAFRKHEELSMKLGANVYFCHPYHSWEKGGVESINGMIRRYIKKGSDISQYEDSFIHEVQKKLNDRPRKKLNFKTPNEIMTENHQFRYCKLISDMRQFNYLKTPLQAFGLRV
jgi:IS30 family transposase